jgi:mono/diheme cytochrome c family protein
MKALLMFAAGLASAMFISDSKAAGAAASRGEYLAQIMDCGGCHTTGVFLGKPDPARYLGGSEVGFLIPGLGIFYPPNLTPDETGLGSWSKDDIIRAVRTGVRPDGRMLAPAMPWHSYAALNDEDANALAAFLKSLPPVQNKVPGPFGPEEGANAPYLAVVMPEGAVVPAGQTAN